MAWIRTSPVALVVAVGALALGGCAPTPESAAASNDQQAVLAVTTAESAAGGRAFELDSDDGEWEVHVAANDREVEVRTSADGAGVTSSRDDDGLDAADRAALEAATTTLADAIRIAAGHARGAAIEEARLESDNATATWVVEVTGDRTVRVSAADGTVG